jgi:hypothetical protein
VNIYLIPICDQSDNYIEKVIANSLEQAKERLYNELFDRFDWTESDNLDDLCKELTEDGIFVGDFYDIEDFQ